MGNLCDHCSQAIPPFASAFMTARAWPVYMRSYMPRPPAQQDLMHAEFEDFARQRQVLQARELEVQHMTRTRNLNGLLDARVTISTSAAVSSHSHKKQQAPRRASSQVASQRSLTPFGAFPSGIEVFYRGAGTPSNRRHFF